MLASLRSSPDGHHVAYISVDDDGIAVADVADGGHMRLIGGTADAHALALLARRHDGSPSRPDNKVFDGAGRRLGRAGPARRDAARRLGAGLGRQRRRPRRLRRRRAGRRERPVQDQPADRHAHAADPDGGRERGRALVRPGRHAPGRGLDPVAFGPHNHLDIINADATGGSGRHTILSEDGVDTPQFSPDGTRIGFTTKSGTDGEDVATIAPDGSRAPRGRQRRRGRRWPGRWPRAAATGLPTADFDGRARPALHDRRHDADLDVGRPGRRDLARRCGTSTATGSTTTPPARSRTRRSPPPARTQSAVKVKDNRGATTVDDASPSTVLVGGRPGASFTVDPANPDRQRDRHVHRGGRTPTRTRTSSTPSGTSTATGPGTLDTGDRLSPPPTPTTRTRPGHREAARDRRGGRRADTKSHRPSRVKDIERCGTEQVGELQLDGCLIVKGNRRIAPDGVTVNGFRLSATPDAVQVLRRRPVPRRDRAGEQTAAILTRRGADPRQGRVRPGRHVVRRGGRHLGVRAEGLQGRRPVRAVQARRRPDVRRRCARRATARWTSRAVGRSSTSTASSRASC